MGDSKYTTSFQIIVSLVQLLESHPLSIGAWDDKRFFAKSKQINDFLRVLREGTFEDEASFVVAVYGTGARVTDIKYRVLKNRVKDKLLNLAANIDPVGAKLSAYASRWLSTAYVVLVAEIAEKRGFALLSFELARQASKDASRVHDTGLEVRALTLMARHFVRSGQKTQYLRVSAEVARKGQTAIAEAQVEHLYNSFAVLYAKTRSERPENVEALASAISMAECLCVEHPTFSAISNLWYLKLLYGQVRIDYDYVIRVCQGAIAWYEEHPIFSTPLRLGRLYIEILECCISTRRYDEGFNALTQCALYLKAKSSNWLLFKISEVILHLHVGHYIEAEQLLIGLRDDARYSSFTSELLSESFQLLEGYTYFMLKTSGLPISKEFLKGLTVHEFLVSKVEAIGSDKEGGQVAYLILNALLLALDRRRLEEFEYRIQSLYKYGRRHLRGGGTVRSRAFIGMLNQLVNAGFEGSLVETRIERYKSRLADYIKFPVIQNYEIVPFDTLWPIVMRLTTDKETRARRKSAGGSEKAKPTVKLQLDVPQAWAEEYQKSFETDPVPQAGNTSTQGDI